VERHLRNGRARRGGPFGGIVSDFGRPVVQTWAGLHFQRGSAVDARFATKHTAPIAEGVDPACVVPSLRNAFATRAAEPGVYSVTLAIDPGTWQSELFTLRAGIPAADAGGTRSAVLHLSRPEVPAS
jgi:hypothetical protein